MYEITTTGYKTINYNYDYKAHNRGHVNESPC